MATVNKNCQINTKASNGDIVKLYPDTKIANVEGLQTSLDAKVDKISGKGLSTNDFTTTEKNKLAGIADGATANIGTVTQVKVGSTAYNPSSGIVSLPAYPTTLPASDVSSWAKASSKPSYTASEVGLGNVGNYKAVSTVASQGLSDTEKSNARSNIGAGTSSFSGSYNDLSNKPTIPTKVSQLTNDSGYTTNTGTVTGVKVGSTSYSPSSGVVSLPAYPTTLPASDVSSWAKASSKPSYTQDEVGDGTTYKRVSATEKTTWNNKGTYSKPSGGIPKTDLASAVQTSLGKADTALQSFTETDPTVPTWAKQSSKPSYTASEVGAIATSARGAANGVASLDSNGNVPQTQLPTASTTAKGGVKVGSNISVSSGTISLTSSNVANALGYTPANNDGVNQALNTRVVSATYGYVQSSTSTIRVYKSADRGVILAVYGSQGGTNKQSSILVFDVQQGILSVRRLTMGGNSEVVDGVTINEYSTYHEAVVTLSVANSQWPPVIIPLMRADSIPQIEVL